MMKVLLWIAILTAPVSIPLLLAISVYNDYQESKVKRPRMYEPEEEPEPEMWNVIK